MLHFHKAKAAFCSKKILTQQGQTSPLNLATYLLILDGETGFDGQWALSSMDSPP